MKSKYNYLGQVGNIHLFEEIPDGPIKDAESFERYHSFFKNTNSFKYRVYEMAEFMTSSLLDKELKVTEVVHGK